MMNLYNFRLDLNFACRRACINLPSSVCLPCFSLSFGFDRWFWTFSVQNKSHQEHLVKFSIFNKFLWNIKTAKGQKTERLQQWSVGVENERCLKPITTFKTIQKYVAAYSACLDKKLIFNPMRGHDLLCAHSHSHSDIC